MKRTPFLNPEEIALLMRLAFQRKQATGIHVPVLLNVAEAESTFRFRPSGDPYVRHGNAPADLVHNAGGWKY